MSDLDQFGERFQAETTFSTESSVESGEGELVTRESDFNLEPMDLPTLEPEDGNGGEPTFPEDGDGGGGGGTNGACTDCGTAGGPSGTGPGAGPGTGPSRPRDGAQAGECTPERSARQAWAFLRTFGDQTPTCVLAWVILAGGALLTLNLLKRGS